MAGEPGPPGDHDFVLLGIRYEAARVGGLKGAALESIAADIRAEVGEGWEAHPAIVRGRNAVRDEHGLARIGEPGRRQPYSGPSRRSLLDRLRGR